MEETKRDEQPEKKRQKKRRKKTKKRQKKRNIKKSNKRNFGPIKTRQMASNTLIWMDWTKN